MTIRRHKGFAVFFLLAGAAALLPAIAPLSPAGAQSSAPSLLPSAKEVPNFAQVAPGIYRGAAPTAEGMKKLKAMGVRTVIDLRIEQKGQAEEAATAQKLGLERLRIRLGREAPTTKQVKTFLSTLDNPAKCPVFIHCQYGADRTGAMVGIYRVTHQGWNFDQAYREMRHYGFKTFLWELKGAVQSRAKTKTASDNHLVRGGGIKPN